MGKVQLAEQRNEPIREARALDALGHTTTDPTAALQGTLLPAAGAKGYGLALMVDFLCALSGGSALNEISSMYLDASAPSECSWLFLAIEPSHFGLSQPYAERVGGLAAQIVREAGEGSLPGDRKREAERRAGGQIVLVTALIDDLERLAGELGVSIRLSSDD